MSGRDYRKAILGLLEGEEDPGPPRARRLARLLEVPHDEYGAFRRAWKELREEGRLASRSSAARKDDAPRGRVEGRLRLNPRGYGFVSVEGLSEDLFVPPGHEGGAMSGDLVVVRRVPPRPGRRAGRSAFEVVEVLERAAGRVVGTLERAEGGLFFVAPDGTAVLTPVIVRDLPAGARAGTKVVAEIVEHPRAAGDLPAGVVVEVLGRAGELEAETRAVIRAHELPESFSEEALAEARRAAAAFDPEDLEGRADLTGLLVLTIDPADARDFDDAVSIEDEGGGRVTLGVHIADVARFVEPGGALDVEARERGTSVYFPRRVVPMLPEVLSNGVCSLQEGQRRLARSVFVTYGPGAEILGRRAERSVIVSRRRLTYEAAEAILDGEELGEAPEVVSLVGAMGELARAILARRREAGMVHLDLPEVRLVLDEAGEVRDAEPEPHLFSHRVIEMLMVEANEAVAALLDARGLPFVRRVHPPPEDEAFEGLAAFARACGHRGLPRGRPSRHDLQALVDEVRGRPEGYALNLALLRSFEKAVYSPDPEGHYALGSEAYCHFTSPIRRYPDLTVHRALDELGRAGRKRRRRKGDDEAEEEALAALAEEADHLSRREREAEAAELELRQVLVLRHLARRVGESFEGVVTGLADFGLFVQFPRFLVEGLLRLEDLGGEVWAVDAARGRAVGEGSGRTVRLGDALRVRIAAVDVARRHLDLALAGELPAAPGRRPPPRRGRTERSVQTRRPGRRGTGGRGRG